MNLEPRTLAGAGPEARERLPADVVGMLHRMLGGDPVTEQCVLDYIGSRWGARSLFELPRPVANAIRSRHLDFLRAARRHNQPEMEF